MTTDSTMLMQDPGAILMQAVQLHQGGQFDVARGLYENVLLMVPEQPDALHLLGVLALQAGKPADAVVRIRRAIAGRPESTVYHGNLGVALQAVGRLEDARESLERAVALDARNIDALFNLGVTLQTLELLALAVERYQQVLDLVPGHPGARRNLGNALHSLEQYAEAVEAYRLALALAPADAGLLGSLGASLSSLGRHDESIEAFEAAATLSPGDADAWLNLALACHGTRRFDRAIAAYQRATELRPEHAEGWRSFGQALSASERQTGAVECFQRALALVNGEHGQSPASTEIRIGVMRDLVSALVLGKRAVEAVPIMRSVVELAPDDADAWRNLGLTLALSGVMSEAATALGRAIELDPTNLDYRSKQIFAMDLLPTTTSEQAFAARRAYNEYLAVPLAAQIKPHTNPPDPERRLRVGYVSADFRRHSAATTFMAVLQQHDPSAVEVVCYSNNATEDDYTERFKALASIWRIVNELSDEELAEQIRADKIDVLVDLSGHSAGNRLLVFARKPAPVQVTAWGYATGTGLDSIDAFFADPVVVPPDDERWYSEQIVHLPNVVSFTPPPTLAPISPLPALSQGYVTFGSYNRAVKITPTVLETWARVMCAVPGSRLQLKPNIDDSPAIRARLLEPLARNGISPDRVEILGQRPHAEHVASFGSLDIQLDPFPHTGGVTTMDGLLMGVPCVTLLGERVAGRLSASFLSMLGLSDLIAHSLDEYVEIAVRLAHDLERLAHERATLRERLLASPIGDGRRYTQAVENAYRDLWRRWCEGQVVSSEAAVARSEAAVAPGRIG